MRLIIVKLFSGMGNQMFQYAAARRLSIVNNDLLKLDISGFRKGEFFRKYSLSHFNIVEQLATNKEISHLKSVRYVKEVSFGFNSKILELERGDVYLEGYWGCEKYFKNIEEIIRKEFTVKYPLTDENKRLADSIDNCQSVAIHVRRGDYLHPRYNNFFAICPLDYYFEAVNRITEEFSNLHFFIFSDDPDWVQQNLKLRFPTTLIRHNGNEKNYEDLRLMSFCNYHIIANSSFSWWGSWLATKPNKIVFAPSKWYNNLNFDISHLLIDSWNLI
jgi:hypothetical protein